MFVGPGINKNNLIFGLDVGNHRLYQGEPTYNYWTGGQYSIYNQDATNYRNSTEVPALNPSYEVVKVVSNTLGSYGHSILWNASYPNNSVATITNSVFAYLTQGDYVQVGQHWHPWYYGTQKTIPKNRWVRISETYTINEGNSYGTAALTYSTNGVAYFTMPQFEYKSIASPFVGANQSRLNNQVLLDKSTNKKTLTSNTSYNSNGLITFDGVDDYVESQSVNITTNQFTLEAVIKPTATSGNYSIIKKNTSNDSWPIFSMGISGNDLNGYYSSPVYGQSLEGVYTTNNPITNGNWYHVVFSKGTGGYTTMKLYINGVSVSYTNYLYGSHINSIATSDKPIHVGRDLDGANWVSPFNGDISIVRVYDRQLSDDEILRNFKGYQRRFNIQ